MKKGDHVAFRVYGEEKLRTGTVVEGNEVYCPDAAWRFSLAQIREISVVQGPYEPQDGDKISAKQVLHREHRDGREHEYLRYENRWWHSVPLTDGQVDSYIAKGARLKRQ